MPTRRAEASARYTGEDWCKRIASLEGKNDRLIAEWLAYSERLKTGPSSNPFENYDMRSDAEKCYRYVIETKQARVVDVIKQIESAGGPA